MKQGKKTFKIVLIILSLVMLTGCTKTLTGEDKKTVKYEETGKALTENILCKPTNKDVIELYKENKVNVYKNNIKSDKVKVKKLTIFSS